MDPELSVDFLLAALALTILALVGILGLYCRERLRRRQAREERAYLAGRSEWAAANGRSKAPGQQGLPSELTDGRLVEAPEPRMKVDQL